MSQNWGYELILNSVSVRLAWYSPRVDDEADPDIDNMAKPYLDALKGVVISDDRNVRSLQLAKVDINSDLQDLPGVLEAKNRLKENATEEFVMIIVEPFSQDDLVSFSAEERND